MIRTTSKELKELARRYNDITGAGEKEYDEIMKKEGYLEQLAYATGIYGCSGVLYRGHNTGDLYIITHRSSALFLFS